MQLHSERFKVIGVYGIITGSLYALYAWNKAVRLDGKRVSVHRFDKNYSVKNVPTLSFLVCKGYKNKKRRTTKIEPPSMSILSVENKKNAAKA